MASVELSEYGPDDKVAWDDFVARSKNGTFLFHRDYMDYHQDRFRDWSRLIHVGDELVGLFPANRDGDRVVSHRGLSYGGIVCDQAMGVAVMVEIFEALIKHLAADGVSILDYRPVPHIYHRYPAEEDLYALFRLGAQLERRAVSSTIRMDSPIAQQTMRRGSQMKKAQAAGVEIARSSDYEGFVAMLASVLETRHGAVPVHTAAELNQLADSFPENIALHTAKVSGELMAGTLIYETETTAHVQYIAGSDAGRRHSALDGLLGQLIETEYSSKRFFDFGISTVDDGRVLNEGLAWNKERWGARSTVYDSYSLAIG